MGRLTVSGEEVPRAGLVRAARDGRVTNTLMSDGAFCRDGSFVPLPEPDAPVLEELWSRSVLAAFVRQGWLDEDAAAGMLAWPHSGFGACLGPRIKDGAALLRVARYCARAPVAESRLRYEAARAEAEVELVADRTKGPYAGCTGQLRWSSWRAGWTTCRNAT